MSTRCDDLDLFLDGELPEPEQASFREHLAGCARCQKELAELVPLELAARSLPVEAQVVPLRPRPQRSARWPLVALAASVAVAFVAVAVLRNRGAPGDVGTAPVALASAQRTSEFRLSHEGASAFRPYNVARASASASDAVPLALLAELEKRGDFHAIATAYLDRGELGQAEAFLARAGPSPEVDSDRAALELVRGRPAEALVLADRALEARTELAAAKWNRGLALRDLGLFFAAAETFEQLEALHEPGWSDEASTRSRDARTSAQALRESWERTRELGYAMVRGEAPIPDELARKHPGIARLFLYDALRTADRRERVEALSSLARVLDSIAGGEQLSRGVAAAARGPFDPELARQYSLWAGTLTGGGTPAEGEALIARARKSRRPELIIGALVITGQAPARLVWLEEAARRTTDPWFTLLAAQQHAAALRRSGALDQAEQLLRGTLARCPIAGAEFRCAHLALALASLLVPQHRLTEAQESLDQATAWATAAGDWAMQLTGLTERAEAARLSDATELASAYLHERELRDAGGCHQQLRTRVAQAAISMQRLRPSRARAELAAAPDCGTPPPLQALLLMANLQRFEGNGAELAWIGEGMKRWRAGNPTPGEEALLSSAAALAAVASGDPAAEARLREAISATDRAPPTEVDAARARALTYSTWTMAEAESDRWDRVFQLAAEELRVRTPQRCAVVASVDDERAAFGVRDATGQLRGEVLSFSTLAGRPQLPEPLAKLLAGCDAVSVLARPPLQGWLGALPPGVPASFVVGPTRSPSSAGHAQRRVIVTDVAAPPALKLPRLGAHAGRPHAEVVLSGSAATPARALESFEHATEIELHAHGFVSGDLPGAARIVLAPDADGRYALTAELIRRQRLAGAPVVVLASCHSGAVAPYFHQGWGLPQAFLASGARAVIAATETLPDADAGRFFAGVLARVRQGTPAAQAVHAERTEWVARGAAWTKQIVVFEGAEVGP